MWQCHLLAIVYNTVVRNSSIQPMMNLKATMDVHCTIMDNQGLTFMNYWHHIMMSKMSSPTEWVAIMQHQKSIVDIQILHGCALHMHG